MSDVYAFTVLLNEIMLEKVPFAALSPHEIWYEVAVDGLRPSAYTIDDADADTVGCRLMELIRIGWKQDPYLRVSFKDLAHNLKQLLQLTVDQARAGVDVKQEEKEKKEKVGVTATTATDTATTTAGTLWRHTIQTTITAAIAGWLNVAPIDTSDSDSDSDAQLNDDAESFYRKGISHINNAKLFSVVLLICFLKI